MEEIMEETVLRPKWKHKGLGTTTKVWITIFINLGLFRHFETVTNI